MLTNSSWTNGREKFRQWRRSRPFWGGLLLLVSGIELFASANLDLTAIQFHIGPEGFLSYLLPVLLLVCGLLVWLTPIQRFFYAIIGTLTAVYALTGLNLGGFLLGTLIGMIGGGLAFAWTPVGEEAAPVLPVAIPAWARRRRAPTGSTRHDPAADEDVDDDPYRRSGAAARGLARHRSPLVVSIGVPLVIAATLAGTLSAAPGRAVADPTTCPPSAAQPAGGQPAAAPRAAAPAPAAAVPAPAAAVPAPAAAVPAPPAAVPTTTTAPTAPTATPPPNPDGPPMSRPPTRLEILTAIQHNIRNAWIEFWAKVFGIPLPPTPTPTPTAAAQPTPTTPPAPPPPPTTTTAPPAPAPAPTTTDPTTAPPGASATTAGGGAPAPGTCAPTTGGASGSPGAAPPPPAAAAAPGQPNVSGTPATLTAATQVLSGFSFVGVVALPTADGGSIRVLQFSAARATSTDFALTSTAGQHSLSINSNPLVVSGTVNLFTSRFSGTLLGVPVTFTPDVPPPLTLPDMTFTDVTIELVFLDTASLQAPTLAQTSK